MSHPERQGSATLRDPKSSSSGSNSVNSGSLASTTISSSLDELARSIFEDVKKCKENADRECTALENENSSLKLQLVMKAAAADELLLDNRRLKDQLRNLPHGSLTPKSVHGLTADTFSNLDNALPLEDIDTIKNALRLERERSSRLYEVRKKLIAQREHDKETMAKCRSIVQMSKRCLSSRKSDDQPLWHFILQLESLMEPHILSSSIPASSKTQDCVSERADSMPAQGQQNEPPKDEEHSDRHLSSGIGYLCKDTANVATTADISISTDSPPGRISISSIDNNQLDRSSELRVVRSSQSTQGDSQPLQANEDLVQDAVEEQRSDPVIISTRYVRRKRNDDGEISAVKQEPNSSPISFVRLAALFPTQQVDLDEVSTTVNTPRKRRRIEGTGTSPENRIFHQGESSLGSQDGSISLPRRRSVDNASLENHEWRRPVEFEPPLLAKAASTDAAPDVARSSLDDLHEHVASVNAEQSTYRRPLRPLSVNARMFSPRNLQGKHRESSANDPSTLSAKEENPSTPQYYSRSDISEDGPNKKPVGQRISSLLDTPFSGNQEYLTPQPGNSTKKKATDMALTTGKSSRISKIRPQSNTKEQRRPDSTPQTRPEEEPLRARPLRHLELADFRVNPKKNKGYTFAYNEVIRGRERQCLPGCTSPDCCGNQFQKMIEIGGMPPTPRGLWDSSQDSNSAQEQLLEQYLGEKEAWRLRSMTEGEKAQLLVEAKTHALQRSYGKHRVAFPRSRTPPGFWRCDMPSTQEIESDRAQSEKMTREKVAERYREALKEDGQWKFRDE